MPLFLMVSSFLFFFAFLFFLSLFKGGGGEISWGFGRDEQYFRYAGIHRTRVCCMC
jgi:hypothetical protein